MKLLERLKAAAAEVHRQARLTAASTVIASKLYRKWKARCEGLRRARGYIVKLYDPQVTCIGYTLLYLIEGRQVLNMHWLLCYLGLY
jgi:hypothetical protein